MEPNPYKSPEAELQPARRGAAATPLFAVVLTLFVALLVTAIGQFITTMFARTSPLAGAMYEFLRPRFPHVGLVAGANPAIFLGLWLWHRKPPMLLCAVFMFLVVAALHAIDLLRTGTVSAVGDQFDRLHSAWSWSVASYAALAAVTLWLWWVHPRDAKQKETEPRPSGSDHANAP